MGKKRLDVLLCERGLAESRQRAQADIMGGCVFVEGRPALKAGQAVDEEAQIEVRGQAIPYVSRGGLKLAKAMDVFSLDLTGLVCADIGASTGGFTDCMLQHGAEKVFAVDTGYGKLAWKLRTDPRVVPLERTNARYLTREQIPDALDFASVDVSFISLRLILPALRGVLKDFLDHAAQADFTVTAMDFSPIRGPEGNIEYLGLLTAGAGEPYTGDLPGLVARSHEALEGGERP